jgi:hypothetical protein
MRVRRRGHAAAPIREFEGGLRSAGRQGAQGQEFQRPVMRRVENRWIGIHDEQLAVGHSLGKFASGEEFRTDLVICFAPSGCNPTCAPNSCIGSTGFEREEKHKTYPVDWSSLERLRKTRTRLAGFGAAGCSSGGRTFGGEG